MTEGTIANLLRHSSTALVRRYAHLSPSYLHEAVEKISRFGKQGPTAPAKLEATKEPERVERKEEEPEVLAILATGSGTGNFSEETKTL